MASIGFISDERLKNLPDRHHAAHEFCFHLHDLMAGLLVEMSETNASVVSFKIEEKDKEIDLSEVVDIFDYLEKSGRPEVAKRATLNHINLALFSDMLHFIYESLIALEKRKFSVALSLLRKPFKEGLILVTWMCAAEDEFYDNLKNDPAKTFDQAEISREKKIELLQAAKERCDGADFIDPTMIHDLLYDRKNEFGLAPLFDKATHLVTRNKHIATEKLNINFIFKNPLDDDLYDAFYRDIAVVLMFLNLIQIDLYSRMSASKEKYKKWMLFSSLGAFTSIFLKGRSPIVRFVNGSMGDFLICPHCDERIRLKKSDAPRFFLLERLHCQGCGMEHHFPFSWLLSKIPNTTKEILSS